MTSRSLTGVLAALTLAAVTAPAAAREPGIATLAEAERAHILSALAALGWNITRTARALDISPTTLRKKIADYGLVRRLGDPGGPSAGAP